MAKAVKPKEPKFWNEKLLTKQTAEIDKWIRALNKDKGVRKIDYFYIGWKLGHDHGLQTAKAWDVYNKRKKK